MKIDPETDSDTDSLSKRDFLKKLGLVGAGLCATLGMGLWFKRNQRAQGAQGSLGQGESLSSDSSDKTMQQQTRDVVNIADQKPKEGKSMIKKLELSQAEWKERLTAEQYYILRKEGTERPFTSELNREKRRGVFHCAGCDLELFTSEMKYDSGTGWPSFFTHIEGHFETKTDRKLLQKRVEYHCARCGGHHGHVFTDGPPPTYERWCNNGIALKFVPAKT